MSLTEQQRRFLDAYAGGVSMRKAARRAGITHGAVYYWRSNPEFDRHFRQTCDRLEEQRRAKRLADPRVRALLRRPNHD